MSDSCELIWVLFLPSTVRVPLAFSCLYIGPEDPSRREAALWLVMVVGGARVLVLLSTEYGLVNLDVAGKKLPRLAVRSEPETESKSFGGGR